jgi:transcription termination factor Rho
LAVTHGLRHALLGRDAQSGLDVLLDRMRRTPDNAAFLRQVQGTLPRQQ